MEDSKMQSSLYEQHNATSFVFFLHWCRIGQLLCCCQWVEYLISPYPIILIAPLMKYL